VPTGTIILLGAFAGLTIFLGMPIAFLKHVPQSLKIFLSMLATGVLIFLLYDVIQQASEPINAALDQLRTQHTGAGTFFLDVFLLICGIGLGSVGLVYFNSFVFKRRLHKKTLTTEAITAASLSPKVRSPPIPLRSSSPLASACIISPRDWPSVNPPRWEPFNSLSSSSSASVCTT